MTLHRFFVEPSAMRGERFSIPPAIQRQLRTVLRLRDGESLVLLCGDGSEAVCRLEGDDCVVQQRRAVSSEPRHHLTVVQALLKSDGLEEVIRRCTEIGVVGFRLIVTERCVARDVSPQRVERLRAIAREAAEQSERGIVPSVEAPVPLATVLDSGSVLLFERQTSPGLSGIAPPSSVIIGPEGGFTAREVQSAMEAGVPIAGLGPRILRSQTVGVAVAAAILSRTGDFA